MQRAISMLAVTMLFVPFTRAQADPGHPVAVRWWGQAMVSIETFGNLHVVIDPYGEKIGYKDPGILGDLVLVTHEHADHNNVELIPWKPFVAFGVELIGQKPFIARGLEGDGSVGNMNQVLDRLPDETLPWWKDAKQRVARTQHAIHVTSIAAWHDDTEGTQRGSNTLFLIEVDGVRIVHCGDLGQPRLTEEQLQTLGEIDVLLIPVGGVYTVDGVQAANIVRQVNPRIVVPIHYKTPNLVYDLQGVQGFLSAVGDDRKVVRAKGNTLAVSATKRGATKTKVVVLDFVPWEMPTEWSELFAAKEQACQKSQMAFSNLNPNLMNFKPSDGTHTPRWNAEHMRGRELLFFSQIYAQVDPAIQPIDVNPEQMPPDYVAAHPDWWAKEETRQMESVSAFTRRFAYLLDGLELDEQAPGSRWTPRGLLEQMQRHYNQHTANVKKKFELPDWPAE